LKTNKSSRDNTTL